MAPPLLTLPTLRYALFAAAADIRASFHRTLLGPLWPTLGLAVVTAALGLFFGTVLRAQLGTDSDYVPNLAAGLIAWTFLAGTLHQASGQIWPYLAALRHCAVPLPALVLRAELHQGLILLQNLLVAAIALPLVADTALADLPSLAAGILLLAANIGWIALLAALLSARFRDIPQLLAWIVHLAFFLTPILWPVHFLGRYAWLADFNPFRHLVELVRLPLLGRAVPPETWAASLLLLALGATLAIVIHARLRPRLPYWN